jgi:hypothetical protein
MPDKRDAIIEQARERFKLVCEAESAQRERENDDLRFQIPENQWDDKARSARQGDDKTPPRPILSISKLDQPQQLILNQMRQADLGVMIHPISEDAEQDTAEMLQGLYRHIEQKSHAELARYWAFQRAVACGRGAYRVLTEYDEEGGHPSDQRIVIKRILHQEGVYFDPSAVEPDFSDGRFAFVVSWVSRDAFARMWPKAKGANAAKLEWEGMAHDAPEWVREDDVLVAEYWYKEYSEEKFAVEGEERTREVVTVKVCKLTGWEVLEESVWPGRWIPIIPVIGRELTPFDEERRFVGLISGAKDGQKLYNYAASTLVERMALEPKAPFVTPAEVIEGYEDYWQQANVRNFPYLPYNAVVKGGAILPPPQRAQIDQTGTSLAMAALQQADNFIQSATAIYDPSLGRLSERDRSGRAILALQQQADSGTGHFLQNLADISMVYEAKVVLDLIPKVYDRPGRITRIVRGEDRKSAPVMLGVPFVPDPRTGRPMPAPPTAQGVKQYDLSRGIYDVSVTIGKSFQTRLQEGSERIGELLAQKPELFVMMGDLFLRFQDWPGAKEMADRMAKVRERQFPGLGESEDGQMPPEQMQAQFQGMQAQMQQMGQQLQAAMQALQTEQAKQQAQIAKAQLDAQVKMQQAELSMREAAMERDTKLRIAAADNETKLQIAGLEAKLESLLTLLNLEAEAKKIERMEQTAERSEERGRQHEAAMTEMKKPAPTVPETSVDGGLGGLDR